MSKHLLCIDTSTDICSVAICDDHGVLVEEHTARDFSHAAMITVMIEKCLHRIGIQVNQLQAIVLASGPGSYTGLRVGASVAKGICYALDIPLISIDTLTSLAYNVMVVEGNYIMALIDARRMDAYMALYDHTHNIIEPMSKITMDDDFWKKYGSMPLTVVGDGFPKATEWIDQYGIQKGAVNCNAGNMCTLARVKYTTGQFEDLRNFSPMYLNQPNITVNKKGIL